MLTLSMANSTAENKNETAFKYDFKKLSLFFEAVIKQHTTPDGWSWLEEKRNPDQPASFNTAFASIPRKTGKLVIRLTGEQEQILESLIPGYSILQWSVDRLARVWLLMQLDPSDKEKYFRLIENLFLAAEINELVALYGALPVLAYPEMWKKRCAEGIRSNIADVLQSIMYENPYPSGYLPEPAWNQLVLKAFFTEKAVNRVYGLDERANQDLAYILSDYAHERWAAHRPVNPQLWRCVGKFVNERIFPDLQRLFSSGDTLEKEAAALACNDSQFPSARRLLEQHPQQKQAIERGSLTWDRIASSGAN